MLIPASMEVASVPRPLGSVVSNVVRRLRHSHPSVPLASFRFEPERVREASELAIENPSALHGLVLASLEHPVGAILTELLAGAGRRLEQAWRSDRISSTERAVGVAALTVESRWLAHRLPQRLSPNPGRVMVVHARISVPALEPALFAIYSNAFGWSVCHAEGPEEVAAELDDAPIDLVLLSVTRLSDLRQGLECVRDGRRARHGMAATTFAVTSPLFGSIARRAGRIANGLFFDVRELVPVLERLEALRVR